MQELFVTNYAANGGNGRRAAIAAGYGKAGAAVAASRMLRNQTICEAIVQASRMMLVAHGPAAIATVSTLMKRAKSEYVRLEAAKDVQTRIGLAAPTKVLVGGQVTINLDLG
jgi:phage terminase small subunit